MQSDNGNIKSKTAIKIFFRNLILDFQFVCFKTFQYFKENDFNFDKLFPDLLLSVCKEIDLCGTGDLL